MFAPFSKLGCLQCILFSSYYVSKVILASVRFLPIVVIGGADYSSEVPHGNMLQWSRGQDLFFPTISIFFFVGVFFVLLPKSACSFSFWNERGVTNPVRMCSLLFQCISPGLVETGFAFKLHDNDPERAAATYESIRVGDREMNAEGNDTDCKSNDLSLIIAQGLLCTALNAFWKVLSIPHSRWNQGAL